MYSHLPCSLASRPTPTLTLIYTLLIAVSCTHTAPPSPPDIPYPTSTCRSTPPCPGPPYRRTSPPDTAAHSDAPNRADNTTPPSRAHHNPPRTADPISRTGPQDTAAARPPYRSCRAHRAPASSVSHSCPPLNESRDVRAIGRRCPPDNRSHRRRTHSGRPSLRGSSDRPGRRRCSPRPLGL